MRQWRSKSNQLKGPRAICWTWVLAFVKPIKAESRSTRSLLRASVIMAKIAELALSSRFLQLCIYSLEFRGIVAVTGTLAQSQKIVYYKCIRLFQISRVMNLHLMLQCSMAYCTIRLRMERGSLLIELRRTSLHDSSKFLETI